MPGADERVVELRGLGLGEGTRRVLQLAEQLGYTVATAGPGSYRLARSRRKLIGKQTESVLVSVYDDRGGTKARFVGPVDAGLLQHLTDGAQPVSTVPPSNAGSPSPVAAPPDAGGHAPGAQVTAANAHSMPTPTDRPTPRPAAAPPGGLISAVPGGAVRPAPLPPPAPALATAPVVRSETADIDARTLVNLRRETVTSPTSEPGLILPGGRFVPLTAPVVIGRDPDPTRGAPGAVTVAVAEPSLSKTHLAISFTAGTFRLTDLHSSNGTVVEIAGARTPCSPGTEMIVASGAAVLAGALVIEVVGP